jgi:hypothetical protein
MSRRWGFTIYAGTFYGLFTFTLSALWDWYGKYGWHSFTLPKNYRYNLKLRMEISTRHHLEKYGMDWRKFVGTE